MIVASAAVVVATALTGSWLFVTVAGLVAVLLGAMATKITHSELMDSREEAARDRAQQARAYADLTEVRTAENVEFAADMTGKVAKREATISRLEKRLGDAAAELADARRELSDARDRAKDAEQAAERLAGRLADADERANHAVVRVAELEAEVDVLRAELQTVTAAWHEAESVRRHA